MNFSKVPVFLAGATGYIGGSILQRLLQHPNAERLKITTLVRDPAKAKVLQEKFGVEVTMGSVTELDKVAGLAENAHIIIYAANSPDNVIAIGAILKGMKNRQEKTGDQPHLIHTSGAAMFVDRLRGEVNSTVYSDIDLSAIEALPENAFNRPAELLVIDADEKGKYVRTYIVTPTMVYGLGHGPLFDAGIANPILSMVCAALKRGSVEVQEQGVAKWMGVHIDDHLYMRIINAIVDDPAKISHGRTGYFISESGSQSIQEILQSIAEGLHAIGILTTMLFSNSLCKGERGRRELSWAPKHTPQDFLGLLKTEVKEYVKKVDGAKSA
ncbi:hypothetical protein BN946_scf184979.g47 [Trametes cinnabarina]|uniref:NAD(P)-binding domain-containing protein n=1 Tax=Pycnoporus cinnabarinus TaxID=5643 RepID=A0A060SJ09_PYCCI|nr:hypothetical protein BN946_scf184979.g47 [Trametes cinnabarina]